MRSQWFLKFAAAALRGTWLVAGLMLLALGASSTALAAGGPPPPPVGTPEIDPGVMGSALAFLTGGTLILVDRLRRK